MTQSTFSPQRFLDHLAKIRTIARTIGKTNPRMSTLRLSMEGRGIPMKTKREIQQSCPSAHTALTVMALVEDMEKILKDLRQEHALASGGVDLSIWQAASLVFYFNRSTIVCQYKPAETAYAMALETAAQHLAQHATLPLANSTRRFELAKQKSNTSAHKGADSRFTLWAPSPELAFARLKCLTTYSLKGWNNPYCAELLDGKSILTLSKTYLETP